MKKSFHFGLRKQNVFSPAKLRVINRIKNFRILFFLIMNFTILQSFAQTIPNSGFENWTWIGGWYENPDAWTTNNAQVSSTGVKKDTNAYQGNYAMQLKNYNTYRAWAQVKFPITTHPFNLIGYVQCSLADSTDTVSIKIILLNNGLPVDSGMWFGTSSISNYTQIKVPLSQNVSITDSAIIVITGGNHLTNN